MLKKASEKPSVMPYNVLTDLIDRDADLLVEEIRRNQSVFPLPSGFRQTIELGGNRLKIMQMTPQLYCIYARKLNPLRFLLSKSPHPNTPVTKCGVDLSFEYTTSGHTLLHLAILSRVPEFVHLICQYGVLEYEDLVNRPLSDETKNTPLHLAVLIENETMVVELLNYGADPFIANAKGALPVELALYKKGPISGLLLNKMTMLNSAFGLLMIQMSMEERPGVEELREKLFKDKKPWMDVQKRHENDKQCTVVSCAEVERLMICYKCRKLFCPYHIERHYHDTTQDARTLEGWRM